MCINCILPCCPVLRPQITGTSELSAGVCVTTNVSAKHEPPIVSGGASDGPIMSNSSKSNRKWHVSVKDLKVPRFQNRLSRLVK